VVLAVVTSAWKSALSTLTDKTDCRINKPRLPHPQAGFLIPGVAGANVGTYDRVKKAQRVGARMTFSFQKPRLYSHRVTTPHLPALRGYLARLTS